MPNSEYKPDTIQIEESVKPEISERFWKKVLKTEKCWNWTSATMNGGYGVFSIKKQARLAHRISFIINHGAIPKGKCVLHKCDNRLCVNPEHLFLGSVNDNNQDMIKKGRNSRGKKHSLICGGDNHSRLKLNSKLVLELRERYSKGNVTISGLARELGIKSSTIGCAISGKSWSSL